MKVNSLLDIKNEVHQAIIDGTPIVALESTIIAHGMPYPQNLETALAIEKIVREGGAVPATIALMGGKIKIGLEQQELEELADLKGKDKAIKVGPRDMGWILAQKLKGATTVAGTMICAHLAGIKVFATGGIGGVHRNGTVTMDISADLTVLAQKPVAVVCSGAKSILDLGLTLEYLETLGVPVVGYGTDEFPAFYTRESGYQGLCRVDAPQEAALIMQKHWQLGLSSGLVIANPISEADALNYHEMEETIKVSLTKAENLAIRGKEVTPFLLGEISRLTGGRSLTANMALVKNNARVATAVAKAFRGLEKLNGAK